MRVTSESDRFILRRMREEALKMNGKKLRLLLMGVSIGSVALTIIGLYFGFPLFACFLFLPGVIGLGGFKGDDGEDREGRARLCPGCGSPVDPSDSFCRVCGRYL